MDNMAEPQQQMKKKESKMNGFSVPVLWMNQKLLSMEPQQVVSLLFSIVLYSTRT